MTTTVEADSIALAVDGVLHGFLAEKAVKAPALSPAVDRIGEFIGRGGKRLRPALCAAGWTAASASVEIPPAVVRVAAALEMFHTFALIHDDVMDGSEWRRGRATLHRVCGAPVAILLGDMAFAWSDELFHTAALSPAQRSRALPLISTMRSQVMCGQYLDITTVPSADLEAALRIIRAKTSSYTIEAPLLIGAAIAGAAPQLLTALNRIARPLGEAFQLRDDLLALREQRDVAGKDGIDDLRAGRHTALIAIAFRQATPEQADRLMRVGRPDLTEDEVTQIKTVIRTTGADAAVEEMIAARCQAAHQALSATRLRPPTADALAALIRHTAEGGT